MAVLTSTESLISNSHDISYVQGKTDWKYVECGNNANSGIFRQ